MAEECPYCQYALSEPPQRFCPSCGRDLSLAATPLPAPGPATDGAGAPWERRQTIGFVAGLTETTQQVLTSPESFFRGLPAAASIGDPLFYAVIVGYIGLVAATIYNAVFNAAFGSAFSGFGAFGDRPEIARIMPFVQGGLGLVVNLVLGPLFIAVGLFIWAGVLHLLLLLLGGGARGFEATFRALAYASASNLLQIVPVCGGFIGFVYGIVLAIIGLSAAHGDSKGKAAAAVLIPLVLCCCCCALGLGAMAGGVASLANRLR
jgi:hypothetical protein